MQNSYAEWAARWRVPLGFALGIAYLIFSRPTARLLVAGGGVALVGLALRAWAAGHLDKNRSLATSGPYACTRNPLYLGSALLGLGFGMAGGSWTMLLAFVGLFLIVYWPVVRQEANFLTERFGEEYSRYADRVPLFFPTLSTRDAGGERFQWSQYKRNREYSAALGYAAGMVFLALKIWLR